MSDGLMEYSEAMVAFATAALRLAQAAIPLAGVLLGAWIARRTTERTDKRTSSVRAAQAALVVFDEIGHLSAPFSQVTRDGYRDHNVREFTRRLEHALAAWREWRQHLVPDYL